MLMNAAWIISGFMQYNPYLYMDKMDQYRLYIFDLDGTLSDPSEGIRNSFTHAFNEMGIQVDIENRFHEIVGPPLHSIFSDTLGFDEQDTEQAVSLFREYYGEKGVYENVLYPGVAEVLSELQERGKTLAVATSKYEKYAHRVLEYHKLTSFFNIVEGASYRGPGAGKAGLIANVLKRAGVNGNNFRALMIGDRKFDIDGAAEMGIDSAGVLYGFGSENELSDATYLLRNLNELLDNHVK